MRYEYRKRCGMDLKADLLSRADAYCEAAGISKARLATIVANDGKFFTRIENGGGFTTRMYERFLAHFAANPPAKHEGAAPEQPGAAA